MFTFWMYINRLWSTSETWCRGGAHATAVRSQEGWGIEWAIESSRPATHQCNRLLFDRLPADMDRWELWWALEIVGFTFYMHIFSEIDSILVNNFNRGLLYFCSALKTQGLTYNCKIVIYEIHVFNSTQLVMIDD